MRSVRDLIDLSGRVALVTGGAGHIGRACCHALAECGADVAVVDINGQQAEEVANNVAAAHKKKSHVFVVDMGCEKNVRTLPDQVVQKLGGLDILVNCAAFVGTTKMSGWGTSFPEQGSEAWRAALEVNLTSCFELVQASLPHLKKSSKGSIINISSIYGIVGPDWRMYEGTAMGNDAAYAASKGGLIQFTRWLSTTLAPEIRANVVSPGGIWRNQPQEFVKRYEERTPMGRMGKEEDMVGAILYLASDLSSYVTGQNIVVDGGWTAW